MKRLALAALVLGAIALVMRWPRLDEVETGRTPEYPDLRVREYRAGEARVEQAARAAIEGLPRWRYVGSGSGPGGRAVQAVHAAPVLLSEDVTVRIKRRGDVTVVGVRSKSRTGPIDFGQNARNIGALLQALDRELAK